MEGEGGEDDELVPEYTTEDTNPPASDYHGDTDGDGDGSGSGSGGDGDGGARDDGGSDGDDDALDFPPNYELSMTHPVVTSGNTPSASPGPSPNAGAQRTGARATWGSLGGLLRRGVSELTS